MLPRIDGIEVIRRLRGEGIVTPALILSALRATQADPRQRFADLNSASAAAGFAPASPSLLPAALSPESVFVAGATDYIIKPVNADLIRSRLSKLVGRRCRSR